MPLCNIAYEKAFCEQICIASTHRHTNCEHQMSHKSPQTTDCWSGINADLCAYCALIKCGRWACADNNRTGSISHNLNVNKSAYSYSCCNCVRQLLGSRYEFSRVSFEWFAHSVQAFARGQTAEYFLNSKECSKETATSHTLAIKVAERKRGRMGDE